MRLTRPGILAAVLLTAALAHADKDPAPAADAKAAKAPKTPDAADAAKPAAAADDADADAIDEDDPNARLPPDVGPAPIPPPPTIAADPNAGKQIDGMLAEVRAAHGPARATAAAKLAQVGEDGYQALLEHLKAARRSPADQLRAALTAIGASMPGKDGVFKVVRAKKRGDDDVAPVEPDWLTDLGKQADDDAVTEAIEVVGLIRGITSTRRLEAARALLDWSFTDAGQIFRDEVGRQIRTMEGAALPGLAVASREHAKNLDKLARYANYQLDKMDRQRPVRALGSVDEFIKVELLRAYGQSHHPDAVIAALNLTDAQDSRVRRMARWALLRYVTGTRPHNAPRKYMKMPGGEMSKHMMPIFKTYLEIADIEIRKKLEGLLGKPPTATDSAAQLAKQMYGIMDEALAKGWQVRLGDARKKIAANDMTGAVAIYDELLAEEPTFPGRGDMAEGFLDEGRALVKKNDFVHAALAFDKAYSVAPDGPNAKPAQAELAFARAMVAKASGAGADDPRVADELSRAMALDPTHKGVKEEVKTMATREAGKSLRWLLMAGVAAGAAGLLMLILFLTRRRAAHS